MDRAVVLLSGGVDSTTLVYDLVDKGFEVFPISFNYGQKHLKELVAAKCTCNKLGLTNKVLDMRVLGEVAPSALTRKDVEIPEGDYEEESMKSTVVPNRNMVLLSLAGSYALGIGAKSVWYGAHGGDHAIYPDCRTEFVKAMRLALELCDWAELQLEAPYLDMTKEEILWRGLSLEVDYSLTWTCYVGGKLACGKCGSCIERREAFEAVGEEDPIKYEGGDVH